MGGGPGPGRRSRSSPPRGRGRLGNHAGRPVQRRLRGDDAREGRSGARAQVDARRPSMQQAVGKRDRGAGGPWNGVSRGRRGAPVSLPGDRATTWRSGCAATTWSRRAASPPTPTRSRPMLASLHEVDVDTWLSAMPASVVQPAQQAEAVDEMLAGIPLPPGFDPASIRDDRCRPGSLSAGRTGRRHGGLCVDRPLGGRPAAPATRSLLARR